MKQLRGEGGGGGERESWVLMARELTRREKFLQISAVKAVENDRE